MPSAFATSERPFYILNAMISMSALGFLAWLLLIHRGDASLGWDVRFLPAVNAALNSVASVFIVLGILSIRRGNRALHRFFMLAALVFSALFLVCYIIYHAVHGDTKYAGTGFLRTLYLSILASHVLLSMAALPGVIAAFYFALRSKLETHKKIVRFVAPIWLYVSVTGVIVFFMLRGAPTAS